MSYQQPSGYDAPAAPPPGWYPDPYGPPALRWWDGAQWTPQTRPLPQPEQAPQSPPTGAYDAFADSQDTGPGGRHRAPAAPQSEIRGRYP